MKIAILFNTENEPGSLEENGILKVFEKAGDSWQVAATEIWTTTGWEDPSSFRRRLGEICAWLGSCKVLAARRWRGTHRVVFENNAISTWELAGFAGVCREPILDSIAAYYEELATAESSAAVTETDADTGPVPIETSPGRYRIDLRAAMGCGGNHSSRRILLPFLEETAFERLEILCPHVPKWFDHTLPGLQLVAEVRQEGADAVVVVAPQK